MYVKLVMLIFLTLYTFLNKTAQQDPPFHKDFPKEQNPCGSEKFVEKKKKEYHRVYKAFSVE